MRPDKAKKNDPAPSQPTPAPQEGQGQPRGSLADLIARLEAFMSAHPTLAALFQTALSGLLGLLAGEAPAMQAKPAHHLAGCGPEECCEAALESALATVAAILHCQCEMNDDAP